MDNRSGFGWLTGLVVLAMLAVIGVYTYNLGLAHGLAESGRIAAVQGQGGPVVVWPHPWGFGFFPIFPLLILIFWFVVLRGLLWGRRGYYRGYGPCGMPPMFDEWHRRAHEQQGAAPAGESKA